MRNPQVPAGAGLPAAFLRHNQAAVIVTTSLVFTGFTIVMPLLPFFLAEIGVETPAATAAWTGILLTVSPLLAALLGPLWGRLADRVGLKLMGQRCLLAMTLNWGLMVFVTDVRQMLVLRVLLGLLSGYAAISVALLTQGIAQKRIGPEVGRLQAAQILSAAAGPFLGGAISRSVGIRATFLVTAALCAAGFLLIAFLYRDAPGRRANGGGGEPVPRRRLRSILATPGLMPIVIVLFAATLLERSFSAVLPILVGELHTDGAPAMFAAGLVISAGKFAGAASAWGAGRWSERIAARRLLGVGFALGALCTVPMAWVSDWRALLGLRAGLGLAVGAVATLAYTAASRRITGSRAASFALLGSATLFGGAVGPLLAGLLGALELRLPLYGNAALYILLAVWTLASIRKRR